jgi:Uma2 family endonuclease
MTAIPKAAKIITPEEYLEGEPSAEVRHEYVGGCVYVVAGGSENHNRIAGWIFSILDAQLDGQICEPFMADMKVKIPPQLWRGILLPRRYGRLRSVR